MSHTLTITIELDEATATEVTRELHSLAGRAAKLLAYGPYGMDDLMLVGDVGQIGHTAVTEPANCDRNGHRMRGPFPTTGRCIDCGLQERD